MSYETDPFFMEALREVREERSATAARTRQTAAKIVDTLVVIALVLVLFLAYGLVDNRWYRIVAIEGGSMSPTIETGDAIVLTRPPAELEVGMVVTLEAEGTVVTHRIVSVNDDGTFTTKGDANDVADDWDGLRVDVVGIQRARIPFLGRLLTSVISITGSGAWHTERISVAALAGGTDCFGECTSEAQESVTFDSSTLVGDEPSTEDEQATVPETTSGAVSPDDGLTRSCQDFTSQVEAQTWFDQYIASYGETPALESDADGVACPALP
ncbi:MAG TPA: signal peptidase I [Acidimicrobiia bacterium]|nr:signal peptidase I [Acidimicrobiia bacterium]